MTPQDWNSYPIWVLPQLPQSKWTRHFDWLCSGLISKRSYTELTPKLPELESLLLKVGHPLLSENGNLENKSDLSSILIASNTYFKNEALLIKEFPESLDPDILFETWILPTTHSLRALNQNKALFFLKDGASSELTWNLHALCQKKLADFNFQFVLRSLNHVL